MERDLDLDLDQDLEREREDREVVADDLLRLTCGKRKDSFCLAGWTAFFLSPRSLIRLRLNSTKIVVIPCRHLEM